MDVACDQGRVPRVGPGGGIVLLTLAEMDRPGLHKLTKRVARDTSQMTRTIRSPETKGLATRTASPHDARVILIGLIPDGERVVQDLTHAVADTIAEILAPITRSDEEILKGLLTRALADEAPD